MNSNERLLTIKLACERVQQREIEKGKIFLRKRVTRLSEIDNKRFFAKIIRGVI